MAAVVGATAAMNVALLAPTGAVAAQTPAPASVPAPAPAPTKIDAMCVRLPGLQASAADVVARHATTLSAASETVAARRAEMTVAMIGFADAVGQHLAALDAGAHPGPTGSVLEARQRDYVIAVVDWSRARTQAFDSERQLVFGELQQTLLDSLDGSACP